MFSRTRTFVVVALGMLATFGLSRPAQASLSNAGFESGSLGAWYQTADYGGPENWNVTSLDAHSGSYSATDAGNKSLRQDFAPVPTSDIAEVSFWEKQPSGSALSAVDLFYSDNTSNEFVVHPSDQWTLIDMTSHLAVGKSLVGISISGYSDGSNDPRTFIDDVTLRVYSVGPTRITITPEPLSAALGLMGLSSLGLTLLGRRRA